MYDLLLAFMFLAPIKTIHDKDLLKKASRKGQSFLSLYFIAFSNDRVSRNSSLVSTLRSLLCPKLDSLHQLIFVFAYLSLSVYLHCFQDFWKFAQVSLRACSRVLENKKALSLFFSTNVLMVLAE